MTPMIDVVFQLLIYFVFTFETPDVLSQMSLYRPAPNPNQPQNPETPPDSLRVVIYPQKDTFALNDIRVGKAAMQRTFNRAADLNPLQPIIIVATAESEHRDLVEVLDMLNHAGLQTISLLSAD